MSAIAVLGCSGAAPTPRPLSVESPAPTAATFETATPSDAGSPAPVDSAGPSPSSGSSLADMLGSQLPATPSGTTWQRVAEEAGRFSFEVPTTWVEQATLPWDEAGARVGTIVVAGPRIANFATDFSIPAVVIGVSQNPSGRTVRAVLEEDDYSTACTPDPVGESSGAGYIAAARLWSGCGGQAEAFLVQIVIGVPGAPGVVAIVFKGASQPDLGYAQHIFESLQTATAPSSTVPPPPAPTGGGSSHGYSINVEKCLLQIGDAIAIGTIRNESSVSHSYRVIVRFLDRSGLLIGEYHRDTPALDPGQAYRWEVRWLAQGYTEVTCSVSDVLIHG